MKKFRKVSIILALLTIPFLLASSCDSCPNQAYGYGCYEPTPDPNNLVGDPNMDYDSGLQYLRDINATQAAVPPAPPDPVVDQASGRDSVNTDGGCYMCLINSVEK